MFDPFKGWSRMIAAGASMAGTGMRAWETLAAANEVIAARTTIIDTAMRSPLAGDHAELGRMVPEKVDAFSLAGSAMVTAWWEAQTAWVGHMQHLGGMAMRGRAPTICEIAELGERTARLSLRSVEGTARLEAAALAPVHRKTMANAKRLRRKPANRSA